MKTTINLILFLALAWNTANAQVGIGTTTPKDDAALEVESTTKGFLPPRLTTTERGDITSPAVGLTIYNKEVNCLQWFNGSGWYNACEGSVDLVGSGFTNGFEDNTTCNSKVISVTPCSDVSGAIENATQPHDDGTLYNWTDAGSYMSGGTANTLVEIGGQCWFGRNTITKPTDPISEDPNYSPNQWGATTVNDEGYWGYYHITITNGSYGWGFIEPATGEGLLYQWSAAMNGSDTERAQGVCPTGWHVPSDCEWMYLENTLGMSTADQENDGWRYSGSVGTKLKSGGSSGFTALLAGIRATNGTYSGNGNTGFWWSSSDSSTTNARSRYFLFSSQAYVVRNSLNKAFGFSVRCLKD